MTYRTDGSILEHFPRFDKGRVHAIVTVDHQSHASLMYCISDALGLRDRSCQRFFTEYVKASMESTKDEWCMCVVGSGDRDRVEIRTFEQLFRAGTPGGGS